MPKRGRGRPARNIVSQNLKESPERNVPVVKAGEVKYSDYLPEFFKIYFASAYSQRMSIPPSFMKNFNGFIPSILTLKSSNTNSWQVHSNMIKEDWYFQKGWPEFVKENSIKDGDFLTFSYDGGSSTFFVKLFAMNGCRKSVSVTENLQGSSRKTPASTRSSSRARKTIRRN